MAAAAVANYCDHAEHTEEVRQEWVTDPGATFRRLAAVLAQAGGAEIVELYADRISLIESRHPLAPIADFDGAAAVRRALTWHELQQTQAQHDRLYHPDVFGLSRADQLRHYAFHAAKLVGGLAELDADPGTWPRFAERRLPDMFLFGIKLATVMSERLPNTSFQLDDG